MMRKAKWWRSFVWIFPWTICKELSENLQVYPNSSYSIRSSKGMDIVSLIDTTGGGKYKLFQEEIDATGWHIEIIIPEDELFKDLNRIGRIVGILMLLGLGFADLHRLARRSQ